MLLCCCSGDFSKEESKNKITYYIRLVEYNTQYIVEGDEISALLEPTKEYYEFDGWYLDAAYSGNKVTSSFVPEGDISLYGTWVAVDEESILVNAFTQRCIGFEVAEDSLANSTYYTSRMSRDGDYIVYTYEFEGDYATYEYTFSYANGLFKLTGCVLSNKTSGSAYFCSFSIYFEWGSFTDGLSVLNEVTYYSQINGSLYKVQSNFFTFDIVSYDGDEVVTTYAPNSYNDYDIYGWTTSESDEYNKLQFLLEEAIYCAERFCSFANITIN